MKKFFIILLSAVCAGCLVAAYGCSKHTDHTWIATDQTDSDGNVIYVCEECGEEHTHTFSSAYTYDSTGHWHAATCEHSDAKSGYSEHVYEEGGTVCTVCGYDSAAETTYNLQFSYYQYDENGDIVTTGDDGTYVTVGVTYGNVKGTSSNSSDSFDIDVENGDTVMVGDVISFTVKKSVFCEYTDENSYPVAYVNDESIQRDSSGVYSFEVASDMATSDGNLIIWVGNVETPNDTITGAGTEDNPYTINCVTDWLYFATYINEEFYSTLNAAYWALGCDLDFEGEELYIVGDGYTSSYAYFMGSFDGNGYTLSNFVIDNEDSDGTYTTYLGVFGICSAYSGISAVIQNLNIDNYTITGVAPSDGACIAGGIVGYAMGFNLVNCSATNGTITVAGNDSYYSYAGGLIGILQSYLDEDNEVAYYSSLQYNTVSNVEITGTGILYAMGGIAGYVAPYAESAPVYIINNAASDILLTGAMRAGGVVGSAGRYTSIQNSYAAGTVIASCTVTTTYDDFKGTQLDDTLAYAGGIAGFCENDTIIAACFFEGSVSATSSSGSSSASSGYLYGGYAEAGYESYYSSALILKDNLNANTASATSADYTEAKLTAAGWQTVDWVFGTGYPAINEETSGHSYTITINVDGATYGTVTVDSEKTAYVYACMSNRYLLYDSNSEGGISIYLRDANNTNKRTYGYYFDEACTQRIPTGYVITGDITIYAKFVDCSAIVDREYYVTGNDTTATIIFNANGSYTYEEGAIYLEGTYEYDGTTIMFKDGYFARLSADASENQAASYFTFYATINSDGNLEIFDCDTVYTDTYSTSYDYLARFFAKSSPLVAVDADNVTFAGKYYTTYEEDGTVYTLEYSFGIDYTGTYTSESGAASSITYVDNGNGTLSVTIGRQTWTATLENGVISIISRTNTTYNLTAYDAFEGTWVQSGISGGQFTFDGKGGYTYTDSEGTSTGTYDVANGTLTLTLGGATYTATVNESGIVEIERGTDSQTVELYNENSLAGVWYTYAYAVTRYTLTLGGLNGDGWGEAEYEGTTGFRYTVYSATSSSIVLYMYYGDTLYAYLTYDAAAGTLAGSFYDSSSEAYSTSHTFYLYDNFYGTWVGSSSDFATVTFNGFGMYNVAQGNSGTRAVSGTATVTNTSGTKNSATYTVDMATGVATLTYNNVVYTLTYDIYTNRIAVTYADGSFVLAEKDEFADVTFYTEGGTAYTFDGRGYLDGGGVVTIGGTAATYSIDTDGVITITASTTYTIYCGNSGYQTSDGTALYIQNSFTGTYAIYGRYTQLTIGGVRYIYSGTDIEISGTYGTQNITLYYNGTQMWFTVEEDGEDVTYYLTALANGLTISITETYTDDEDWAYVVTPDSLYGTWTASDGATLAFDGTLSTYVAYGSVTYSGKDENGDAVTYTGLYYYSTTDSCYVVYFNSTYYYYTLESSATAYAYANGTSYLAEVAE